jgi:transposase
LPPAQRGMNYSTVSISLALCKPQTDWSEKERPFLIKLLEKSSSLKRLWELNLEFKDIMKLKKADGLKSWCEKAAKLSSFKSFVRGIGQDFEAVNGAMCSQWSNGQTEGQINRLKITSARCTAGQALNCCAYAFWLIPDNFTESDAEPLSCGFSSY